jgi:hypothetical protein
VKEDGTLGDNLNASLLQPNDNGECLAHSLINAISVGSNVAPALNVKAGVQPAPKTIAGAPQTDETIKKLEEQAKAFGKSQNRSPEAVAK